MYLQVWLKHKFPRGAVAFLPCRPLLNRRHHRVWIPMGHPRLPDSPLAVASQHFMPHIVMSLSKRENACSSRFPDRRVAEVHRNRRIPATYEQLPDQFCEQSELQERRILYKQMTLTEFAVICEGDRR